jgi:8-oxo-dGTP pyrophosphatase MutT (NUDIX family)
MLAHTPRRAVTAVTPVSAWNVTPFSSGWHRERSRRLGVRIMGAGPSWVQGVVCQGSRYTADMLIDKKEIFCGRVIQVSVDTVDLPNGVRIPLEIVRHPGGAAAAAIDDQNRICLLRQFRHAAGGYIYELPAGKLEPDEPPEVTVRRELVEEAAISASQWQSLGSYVSSPGCFTEIIHLYLATDLSPADGAPDADEVFQVEWWPLEQAVEKALNGELTDAKTIIGILRAASRRNGSQGASLSPKNSLYVKHENRAVSHTVSRERLNQEQDAAARIEPAARVTDCPRRTR